MRQKFWRKGGIGDEEDDDEREEMCPHFPILSSPPRALIRLHIDHQWQGFLK